MANADHALQKSIKETLEHNNSKEIFDNLPMQKNNLHELLQEIDTNNTNLEITMNTNNLI
ncbi:hypothetical protein C1645_816017 [Glomus cerebriforme]|uniref:Uncharacterized protein n=1 Tax=Glomus cerebriforme TaxID=658196 RepID=A0A397TME4_9GLOM|nr:hypothetical protein C1645_816017 [Glomus cerebriforme]